MYDIHCHILPNIDDGPKKLEEALGMARIAATDGTRVVIATPHGGQVEARGGREALSQRVYDFNLELKSAAIDLRVVMGVEHFLATQLLDQVQRGSAISLNDSRYLLVEIDFMQYPHYTDEALFQLQVAGFTPVLAHPERQATIQKKPELLAELIERGILSQITGGSLLGDFGSVARRSAEDLLRRNLVHAIASDGHSATRNRPPVMSNAIRIVEQLMGKDVAHTLGIGNTSAIIADEPVKLPTIKNTPRRRFWWVRRQKT